MQPTKVACPLCQAVATLYDAAPLGKHIPCQRCGKPYAITADCLRRAQPPVAAALPVAVPVPVIQTADGPWWAGAGPAAGTLPRAPLMGKLVDTAPARAITDTTPLPARALPAEPAPTPIAVTPPAAINPLVTVGLAVGGLVVLVALASVLAFVFLGNEPEPKVTHAAGPQETKASFKPVPLPPSKKEGGGGVQPAPDKAGEGQPKDDGGKPKDDAKPKDDRPGPKDDGAKPKDGPKDGGPADPVKGPGGADLVKAQPPAVSGPTVVTPELQKKIDEAIARGVKFLRESQNGDGTWTGNGHALGTTALPALTLLECGVPAKDPGIVAATNYVRKHAVDNTATYEISLAILLLDKVADKKDKPVIQALALRLLAGQTANGGWGYDCPMLSTPEATQLLATLKKNRPKAPSILIEKEGPGGPPIPVDKSDKGPAPNPLDKGARSPLPAPAEKQGDGFPKTSWLGTDPDADPLDAGFVAFLQPPVGAKVPAGQPPKDKKDKDKPKSKRDDNSNTQFAMLALWAARRHDVPVEAALTLVEQRYRSTQLPEGGWGYQFQNGREKPSMTCVGLLGIALGRGSNVELAMRGARPGQVAKKLPLDKQIRDGFASLGPHLEKQMPDGVNFPPGLSLYYMWSVERVAVLYDLRLIAGHDWYHWGVDILLPTQRANGSWQTGSYPGSNSTIDTCFALLFLKRVNLVQDLTENLRLYIPVDGQQEPQPK
jgi:hypothetical protein